jgi:hypothetical protein
MTGGDGLMRRTLVFFLALCLLLAAGVVAVEAKGKPAGGPEKSKGGNSVEVKERVHAKQAIMRTNSVVKAAQKAAAKGGNSTGLGLAVGHQRFAVNLYQEGRYQQAIYHTLRSRELAAQVIERNKGVRIIEITLTPDEDLYVPTRPKVDVLDKELTVTFAKEIPLDNLALKLELTFNL